MTKPLDPIEATTVTRARRSTGHLPHASDAGQAAAHEAACANCGATLAGEYCHHCGQYAHNPLTSFRHAVEDIFESFWHLDGRIFRTLRELFVPGRVARSYLAGHRVRYIPPLRLFVILSLLTFFVGKLVLHVDVGSNQASNVAGQFERAQTVEEVQRIEQRMLAPIKEAEQARTAPGVDTALIAARVRIQGQAATRIVELREQAKADKGGGAKPTAATTVQPGDTAGKDTSAKPQAGAEAGATAGEEKDGSKLWTAGDGDTPFVCRFNGTPWHPTDNPVRVAWMPGFANSWFNKRVGRACDNLKHADQNIDQLFQQFLGAVPTALFLLMPLFALLLKLCFLGSGRSYLEHMVVALYSHCFLLLMLMVLFLLAAASNAGAPGWLTGIGHAAVWIFMPIYLWLMQRRVYGGGWWINALRYLVIGFTYFVLVTFATVYAALLGISS